MGSDRFGVPGNSSGEFTVLAPVSARGVVGFVTGARGLLVKIRVQGGDDQWFRALRSGPAEAGET